MFSESRWLHAVIGFWILVDQLTGILILKRTRTLTLESYRWKSRNGCSLAKSVCFAFKATQRILNFSMAIRRLKSQTVIWRVTNFACHILEEHMTELSQVTEIGTVVPIHCIYKTYYECFCSENGIIFSWEVDILIKILHVRIRYREQEASEIQRLQDSFWCNVTCYHWSWVMDPLKFFLINALWIIVYYSRTALCCLVIELFSWWLSEHLVSFVV